MLGRLALWWGCCLAVTGSDVVEVEREEGRWIGLVHGVPMSFARALDAPQVDRLRRFLLEREPAWRALAEDERWVKEEERTQLSAKFSRYNVLRELLESKETEARAVGRALRGAMVRQLVALMGGTFEDAVGLVADDDERAAWRKRLKAVDTFDGHTNGPFEVGAHVQVWANAHRGSRPNETGLSTHNHRVGWHGYVLVDAEPTATRYLDLRRNRFDLNNSDGVMVLLCGGVNHGVAPVDGAQFDGDRPRLSVAFDIELSTAFGSHAVTHPGARFDGTTNVQRLDDGRNQWVQLATSDILEDALNGRPALAVDFDALIEAQQSIRFVRLPNSPPDLVDLATLLLPLRPPTTDDTSPARGDAEL